MNHGRVLVVPIAGRSGGDVQGTTWGDMGGMPAFTRLHASASTWRRPICPDDWTTTHELVHWAFPSLPDDQHWMEEAALATYKLSRWPA